MPPVVKNDFWPDKYLHFLTITARLGEQLTKLIVAGCHIVTNR
jgi:hypothetical protein